MKVFFFILFHSLLTVLTPTAEKPVPRKVLLPTANAGVDQTITLPSSAFLNGSGSSPGHTIVSYNWTKIAGPTSYNLVSPSSAGTFVNSLSVGTYTFRLTVVDDIGQTDFDQMTLTVNPNPSNTPPFADAGTDISINLPVTTCNLHGSGSFDSDGTIASYTWTKLSGPTYSISNPNIANPTLTSLQQGAYVFQLTVTDNSGASSSDNVTVTVNPPYEDPNGSKLIKPVNIMDFSGYSSGRVSKGGGGNTPYYWFDGSGYDPNSYNLDRTTFTTDTIGFSTTIIPWRGFYHPIGVDGFGNRWRGNRGMRLILDFSGDKDMFNLKKVKFTEIYGMQLGGDFQDTLFLYNFDTVFTYPVTERWKYIARPDSLLVPFAKMVMGSTISWYPTWAHDSFPAVQCRYVYVRIKYKDRGGYISMPDFRELAFYGSKQYADSTVTPMAPIYSGPLPQKKNFRQITGTNNFGVNSAPLKFDGIVRGYSKISAQYDTEIQPFGSQHYDMNFYGFPTSAYLNMDTSMGYQIDVPSIRGASAYLGSFTGNGESVNVTTYGMEPEDPNSYARDGDFVRSFSRFWGFNKDTANLASFRLKNTSAIPNFMNRDTSIVGKGYIKYYEPGNEDEFRGTTYIAAVMRAIVYYDGWEGRIKNTDSFPVGIRNGDSSMKLVMPASVYLDSNGMSCKIFLCRLMRNDKKVVWDVFNEHHYSRTYNDIDHGPTYEDQIGGHGRSPEQDNMYERVKYHRLHLFNWLDGDTTKRYWITEWGYDNNPFIPQTVGDVAALFTTSGTPIIPGLDSCQSKGTIVLRGESEFAIAGIDGYTEFAIANGFYADNNNSRGLFATVGRGGHDPDMTVKFPNYFSTASFRSRLYWYKADTLIRHGDTTGAWIIKWRNVLHRDSVCYEIYNGTINGSTSAASVNVGAVKTNAEKYLYSFTSVFGTKTTQSISAKTLSVTATERPTLYFFEEVNDYIELPGRHRKYYKAVQ